MAMHGRRPIKVKLKLIREPALQMLTTMTFQGTCFADGNGEAWLEIDSDNDDKYVSMFSETKQRDKPCSLRRCGGMSNVGGKPWGNSLSPIQGHLRY